MRIIPVAGDATDFITSVSQVMDGLIYRYQPPELFAIQIDNWFGPKWLGFSGTVMPQLGVWNNTLSVPPFIPGRVISQRRFKAPIYREVQALKPIHQSVRSFTASRRRMAEVAPEATVIWYSGNSLVTGRGSLMVYLAAGDAYRPWYAQWEKNRSWKLAQSVGIEVADLERLMDPNRIAEVSTPASVL